MPVSKPPARFIILSRISAIILIAMLACLLPANSSLTSQPVAAASGEGWYRDGAPRVTKDDPPADKPCYFAQSITASDGSCSGQFSWKEAGCNRGSGGCSGTCSGKATWAAPPSYLQPGTTIELSASASTSRQYSCGDIGCNAGMSWYYGNSLLGECSASDASKSIPFKVPAGTAGAKMFLGTACGIGFLHAGVDYDYVYKASGTPPVAPPAGTKINPIPPPAQTTIKKDDLAIMIRMPTDGSQLTRCQNFAVKGRIKRGDTPVANAAITFIIYGPGVKSPPVNVTSDNDGIFDWSGNLPEKEGLKLGLTPSKQSSVPVGDWHVSAVGTDKGDTAKAQSNFVLTTSNCLCDEAKEFFSEEMMQRASHKGKIRIDFQSLSDSFSDGIKKYISETKRMPYKSNNVMGTIPASTWLANYGGKLDTISRQFVFNDPNNQASVKGTEPSLRNSMVYYFNATGRKLTPGDILYLALKERDGDMKQALLLAHNTLRSLGRESTDRLLTNVDPDPQLCERTFETIRVDDNMGPLYHMFGTAYFEMEARGEWGPGMILQVGDKINEGVNAISPWISLFGGKTLSQNSFSELLGTSEQIWRQFVEGQAPDPEKYCINYWGIRIGQNMYESLGYASDADKYAKLSTEQAVEALKTRSEEAHRLYEEQTKANIQHEMEQVKKKINAVPGNNLRPDAASGEVKVRPSSSPKVVIQANKCPADIVIADQNCIIMFEQSTSEIHGFYPGLLIPIPEPDGSWGLAWFDDSLAPHQQVLTATGDGTIEVLRIDPYKGKVATYTAQTKKGEVLVMNIQPQQLAPEMKFSDGRIVTPVLSTYPVKLKPAATSATLPKCFIATATYGSETAKELDTLRAFRDKVLLTSDAGKLFVDTYYRVSPPLAEFIAEHEDMRTFVREAMLDPIVAALEGTQEMWDVR